MRFNVEQFPQFGSLGQTKHRILRAVFLVIFNSVATADIIGCEFYDTVNVSGTARLDNGFHLYKNVTIPYNQTAIYNYTIVNQKRVNVANHTRGCLPKATPYVRFCCSNPESKFDGKNCMTDLQNINYTTNLNINTKNGDVININISKFFTPLYGKNCDEMYLLDLEYEGNQWTLYENGDLLLGNQFRKTSEYCLHPGNIKSEMNTFEAYYCVALVEPNLFDLLNLYLSIISIVSIVLAILLIVYMGNLTHHRNCLICYLTMVGIAYLVHVLATFPKENNYSKSVCVAVGYIGYYSLMAAFLWLTVISLSMWNNFRGTNFYVTRTSSKMRFLLHSTYAWGGASLFLMFTILADKTDIIPDKWKPDKWKPDEWKPNVGIYTCWIDTNTKSAWIYLYGPMLILIMFNLIMFILTAINIFNVKKSVQTTMKSQECSRRLSSDQRNFSLFLRIFFLMGITWLLEIITYSIGESKSCLSLISSMARLLNSCLGIIMLLLFVDIKKVYQRFKQEKRGQTTESLCTQVSGYTSQHKAINPSSTICILRDSRL